MRLASRPRPTRLPAHPGPDRTDGNAHARLRPTPAAPERPPAWSPSNVHAAVSGVHDGRHDRTGSGQRMPGRVRPDTVPSTGHASRTGSDADRGTDERARKEFGHPRSPRPQGGPPGHAEPSPVGPAFAAWQPRSAPRWQHCQRDRYHGSDQAAAWCRSSVQAAPRRTALLGRFRVERRASGSRSSVMASASAGAVAV
jgi:hypothetical protein